MYTSVLLVALAGVVTPGEASKALSPQWNSDYTLASKEAVSATKPLAVVLGSGQSGWKKLSQDGALTEEINQVLARDYVCVYVDTATVAGKVLARDFEISSGLGIVISDRTGKHQAFRHEGDLANRDLSRYLVRYADSKRVFRATESNPGEADGQPRAGSTERPETIFQSSGS